MDFDLLMGFGNYSGFDFLTEIAIGLLKRMGL
jgi:hypothetical protein